MRFLLQVETLHAYQVSENPIGFLQVLQRFQGAVSGLMLVRRSSAADATPGRWSGQGLSQIAPSNLAVARPHARPFLLSVRGRPGNLGG
jgi:hypothetical protein